MPCVWHLASSSLAPVFSSHLSEVVLVKLSSFWGRLQYRGKIGRNLCGITETIFSLVSAVEHFYKLLSILHRCVGSTLNVGHLGPRLS